MQFVSCARRYLPTVKLRTFRRHVHRPVKQIHELTKYPRSQFMHYDTLRSERLRQLLFSIHSVVIYVREKSPITSERTKKKVRPSFSDRMRIQTKAFRKNNALRRNT